MASLISTLRNSWLASLSALSAPYRFYSLFIRIFPFCLGLFLFQWWSSPATASSSLTRFAVLVLLFALWSLLGSIVERLRQPELLRRNGWLLLLLLTVFATLGSLEILRGYFSDYGLLAILGTLALLALRKVGYAHEHFKTIHPHLLLSLELITLTAVGILSTFPFSADLAQQTIAFAGAVSASVTSLSATLLTSPRLDRSSRLMARTYSLLALAAPGILSLLAFQELILNNYLLTILTAPMAGHLGRQIELGNTNRAPQLAAFISALFLAILAAVSLLT